MHIAWAASVCPLVPRCTYKCSKDTNPLSRVKLVYPGTLEQICTYEFANFFFELFFDNPLDPLGSTVRELKLELLPRETPRMSDTFTNIYIYIYIYII